MPRGKISRGTCLYCGQEFAKNGIVKHLAVCPPRQAAITKAEAGQATPETLHHLRVQNSYSKAFWLDLEMRGSASLNDLDKYLRATWLECCGHLSEFSLGYGNEIAKRRKVAEVFAPGAALRYVYDFGSSTELEIECVAVREGKPTTARLIALMARNLKPEVKCVECGEPAEWLCMECIYEQKGDGTFCEAHIEEHPCEDYGEPVRMVNSPRVGVCGYDGDALPPY